MDGDNSEIRENLKRFTDYRNSWCLNCNYNGPQGVRRAFYPTLFTWRIIPLVWLGSSILVTLLFGLKVWSTGMGGIFVVGIFGWGIIAYVIAWFARGIFLQQRCEIVCPHCGAFSIYKY